MYSYFIVTLILMGIWGLLFVSLVRHRRELVVAGILSVPLGFGEILFVPEYWQPNTLFGLAEQYRLDIESILFSFAVGGIASTGYWLVGSGRRIKKRHRTTIWRILNGFVPVFVFLPAVLYLRCIDALILSLAAGAVATMIYRKDLVYKMLLGGIIFTALYVLVLLVMSYIDPSFTFFWTDGFTKTAIGLPLEEILYALSFGTLWPSIYERLGNYEITP